MVFLGIFQYGVRQNCLPQRSTFGVFEIQEPPQRRQVSRYIISTFTVLVIGLIMP